MKKEYKIKQNEICRNCKGEGVVEVVDFNTKQGYSSADSKPCQICNGYGIVVVTKEIKMTIKPKIELPF